MVRLEYFAGAEIHMDAARQAWVETANRAHDIDAAEILRSVLLKDGRVLDRIFIGPRCTVDITRTRIPGRRDEGRREAGGC